jgi:hypothetical protein
MYVVFRGGDIANVAAALAAIISANAALREYAADRRQHLASL